MNMNMNIGMTKHQINSIGSRLIKIADEFRAPRTTTEDYRGYIFYLLTLRHISNRFEAAAIKELGDEWPTPDKIREYISKYQLIPHVDVSPLNAWYAMNPGDVKLFENQMQRKLFYNIKPGYLWSHIVNLARANDYQLLDTLQASFKSISNESRAAVLAGLFSGISFKSSVFGETQAQKNAKLRDVILKIEECLAKIPAEAMGDICEYLIDKFAAKAKLGENQPVFYTPRSIINTVAGIAALDPKNPANGTRKHLASALDFACGPGSLLLNTRKHILSKGGTVGKIFGQELNYSIHTLTRINFLLHDLKLQEFETYRKDALVVHDDSFRGIDLITTCLPFLNRVPGTQISTETDLTFLLHKLNYLNDDGVAVAVLPPSVLFMSGANLSSREKLLKNNYVDAVIGLPAELFYSINAPMCILVLKKNRQAEDILFINAREHYKRNRQRRNYMTDAQVALVIDTYQHRKEIDGFSRRVELKEIEAQRWLLQVSRFVSMTKAA